MKQAVAKIDNFFSKVQFPVGDVEEVVFVVLADVAGVQPAGLVHCTGEIIKARNLAKKMRLKKI